MGDTATTVVNHADGTSTKTIHTDLAQEDLVDALTNAMHVYGGEMPEQLESALDTAQLHYEAEKRGEDGVTIEVVE